METTATQGAHMTADQLAALVLAQTKLCMRAKGLGVQVDWQRVKVTAGRKYTRIDRGAGEHLSGYLMIDNATGEIFGIKAYGVPHKSYRYGVLADAAEWFWGDYGPRLGDA
jgi:hypothetical protein